MTDQFHAEVRSALSQAYDEGEITGLEVALAVVRAASSLEDAAAVFVTLLESARSV